MNKKKLLSWAAVLIWMLVIFSFSAQVAEESSQLSMGITRFLTDIMQWITPFVELENGTMHFLIRKAAHFFVYFVLGIFLLNALRSSGVSNYKAITLAFLLAVLYAISDEVHQLSVPGRVGNIKDVFIDSHGAAGGIAFYYFLSRNKTP